jgi:hypothetical protein
LIKNICQEWYADDSGASGVIQRLREWWDMLIEVGTGFGYYVNTRKSWLIVKEEYLPLAKSIFAGSNINITYSGRPYLGAPIGTQDYVDNFISEKTKKWIDMITKLSDIAECQPHASHAVITHGLAGKWLYLCRTVPNISHQLEPLELTIISRLIPALTGKGSPNDQLWSLLSLPARLGGLGTLPPTDLCNEFDNSLKVTSPLVSLILSQSKEYSYEIYCDQMTCKNEIRNVKRSRQNTRASEICKNLPTDLQYAMELAQEKGASSWLTTLPISEHGFTLHKETFVMLLQTRKHL